MSFQGRLKCFIMLRVLASSVLNNRLCQSEIFSNTPIALFCPKLVLLYNFIFIFYNVMFVIFFFYLVFQSDFFHEAYAVLSFFNDLII